MPIQFDDRGMRTYGVGVPSLQYYDDSTPPVLRREVFLLANGRLNIEGEGGGGIAGVLARAWLGNEDADAIRFQPDRPAVVTPGGIVTEYDTIAAGLAAASSGDAVVIPPGTYDESITLVDGVLVTELISGTVVIHSTSAIPAVTTVSGGYIRVKEIKCTSTANADTFAVTASHGAGMCYVLAELIQATNVVGAGGGNVFAINQTGAGTLMVWADRIEAICDYWDCAAAYIEAGTQYIYANRLTTTGTGEAYLYTARVLGGTQYIWADRLEANGDGTCTAAYGGGGYPGNYQYIWADCIATSTGYPATGAYSNDSTQEIHGNCVATGTYYAYGASKVGGTQKIFGDCSATCTEATNSYAYGAMITQDNITGVQEVWGNCLATGGAESIGALLNDSANTATTTQRINGDVVGDDYGAKCEIQTQTLTNGRASGGTADLYQVAGTLQIRAMQYDSYLGTITWLPGDRPGRTKWTANAVSITNGTITGAVATLQTFGDGSFLKVDEAAATPGMDLIVDFVSVTAFTWVNVVAAYDGQATHGVGIQLYNWVNGAWDTFDALQTGGFDVTTAGGYVLVNHDFLVVNDAAYIGTGGSAGQVRMRFYHTMAGNASHDLWVDVCALYH